MGRAGKFLKQFKNGADASKSLAAIVKQHTKNVEITENIKTRVDALGAEFHYSSDMGRVCESDDEESGLREKIQTLELENKTLRQLIDELIREREQLNETNRRVIEIAQRLNWEQRQSSKTINDLRKQLEQREADNKKLQRIIRKLEKQNPES